MTGTLTPSVATPLHGTHRAIGLNLRLERLPLLLWVAGLVAYHAVVVPALDGLYDTEAAREELAASLSSPAGLAFSGPAHYLDDYTIASILAHQNLSYTTLIVGLMSISLVVRRTRVDEEAGRAELLGSHPLGVRATLTAALLVALGANLAVAVLLSVVLPLSGDIDVGSAALYGAAHAATGLAFAGLTALHAQLVARARLVWGLGMGALGLAFGLRAVGDASDGTLTWLSPVGWAQLTWVGLDDERWWPLLLPLVLAAVTAAAAMVLVARRDLGRGLVAGRSGPARARRHLRRQVGLTFQLHRGTLLGFVVGLAFLTLGYGSTLADIDSLLADVEPIQEAMEEIGGDTPARSFASFALVVVAVIASFHVVLGALRPRGEEASGRAEALLAAPLSRLAWLGGHAAVVLVGGAVVMVSAGLVFGLSGTASTGDSSLAGDLVIASLAYLPALWVVAGITFALYGWLPRVTALAWVVPVHGFVASYLGQLLDLPDWLRALSPLGHVPRAPAAPWSWTAWVVTAAVAAALLAVALAGFARRDLSPSS